MSIDLSFGIGSSNSGFTGHMNNPLETRRASVYNRFPKPSNTWNYYNNNGYWIIGKDNGEIIPIGPFSIDEYTIIGGKADGTFKAIIILYSVNGVQHMTKLTFKQLRSRNMLQYFEYFLKHPRCQRSQANDLIYMLLQKCQKCYVLTPSDRPGWSGVNTGMPVFMSGNAIPAWLDEYYPKSVKKRRLINTGQLAYKVLSKLDMVLTHWKLKTVWLTRVSSLIQTLAVECGLQVQCVLGVEPSPLITPDILTALLKTQNYESLTTNTLDTSDTTIKLVIDEVNDGTAIFFSGNTLENSKQISHGVSCLLRNVQQADGNEQRAFCQICIISKYALQFLPAEYSCRLSFEDVQTNADSKQVQLIAGQSDFLLIQWIKQNYQYVREQIYEVIRLVEEDWPQEITANKRSFVKMLIIAQRLYRHCFNYEILNSSELNQILNWLKSKAEYIDVSQEIVDDFSIVLNNYIRDGLLQIIDKHSPFVTGINSAVIYDGTLCFEPKTLEHLTEQMTTTQSLKALIDAMIECDFLCTTNKNRRPIQMYTPEGKRVTIHAYSINQHILDADNQYRIDNLSNEEFLYRIEDEREQFLPLVRVSDRRAAGRKLIYENAENNHIYVTGQSGYGKTFALSQLAAFHSMLGYKVVILDASRSFTKDSLLCNLPEDYVQKYVRFHSLEQNGIPVNLFNIDECYNLPNKKKTLMSTLTAATRELSVTQANALKNALSDMFKLMNDGEPVRTGDILAMIDSEEKTGESLIARLSSVFEDLDACGMSTATWEAFFMNTSPITVISTETSDTENGTQILDMLISSLYQYQCKHSECPLVIIIDELQNQNFDADGPISRILKEGRKSHISFIGATQNYYSSKSKIGDVMAKADTKIFLKPTRDSEHAVASELRWSKNEIDRFDRMERGDCIVKGDLYSRTNRRNCPAIICGKVPTFMIPGTDEDNYTGNACCISK